MSKAGALIETQCGVIGKGLAGHALALELADAGMQVDLYDKEGSVPVCNSRLIKGGISAVPRIDGKPLQGDSPDLHVKDTLRAGKGLNDAEIVRYCVEHFYSDVVQWLIDKRVQFDKSDSGYEYSLNMEGGHSTHRIFHAADTTGLSIMETLDNLVVNHPNVRVHRNHMVIDLITRNRVEGIRRDKDRCLGFYVYDIEKDRVKTVACKGTFIATGGLGKVFLYTSNSDVSSGDGFAMCYRAHLPLANMEFVQFHPSVFYDPRAESEFERRFLFTEALRGEGAILKLYRDSKDDFVLEYDPRGSKATRDTVVQAEDIEMRKNGLNHVWLDCTSIDEGKLRKDFRSTYAFCEGKGMDLAREPVPVTYAAHYSNGGVSVGPHGETEMVGCYVVGETSHTGLHGGNRLASNSAPECVLFGRLAAQHFLSNVDDPLYPVPLWDVGRARESRDKTAVGYFWETIRRTMTGLCGISRNEQRLTAARNVLASLKRSINEFYWDYRVSRDFLEVRNIADVAAIILDSALTRKESRACHYREDHPETDDKNYRGLTIVRRNQEPYILGLRQDKLGSTLNQEEES